MDLPASLTRAMARKPDERRARIEGADVHYLTWNPLQAAKPGLLFAHGYRGHARWWSAVAPFFTDRFRVCALNFSGMGDSGWRGLYDHETFTRDLLGVMTHAGMPTACLIGHSFGGGIVLRAAAAAPQRVSRAIAIDSWIRFPDEEREPAKARLGGRGGPYPDFATIRARYRLIPAQPVVHPELLDFVALHSIRRCDAGCDWKFDPDLPFAPGLMETAALLPTIRVPTDYIYGELSSIVDTARARRITAALPRPHAPIAIPDAHHHIMLDQPLALISALRALLA